MGTLNLLNCQITPRHTITASLTFNKDTWVTAHIGVRQKNPAEPEIPARVAIIHERDVDRQSYTPAVPAKPERKDTFYGLRAGLFNCSGLAENSLENIVGMDLGVYTLADQMTGLQLGLMSYANKLDGVQLGGGVFAEHGRGVQVGAAAASDDWKGLQLGLVNYMNGAWGSLAGFSLSNFLLGLYYKKS